METQVAVVCLMIGNSVFQATGVAVDAATGDVFVVGRFGDAHPGTAVAFDRRSRTFPGLLNAGLDCWLGCGGKGGACADWCGTAGACCRREDGSYTNAAGDEAEEVYLKQLDDGDWRNVPGMVRVSLGLYTTFEDLETLCEALTEIAQNADKLRAAYTQKMDGSYVRNDENAHTILEQRPFVLSPQSAR